MGEHASIAVRVSDHPVVCALCDAFGGAIVSTSANQSTQPPAMNYQELAQQFQSQVDCVQGDLGQQTKPSSIYDAKTGQQLRG